MCHTLTSHSPTKSWLAALCLADCAQGARHVSKHMDIPSGMKAVMDSQCNPSQVRMAGVTTHEVIRIMAAMDAQCRPL